MAVGGNSSGSGSAGGIKAGSAYVELYVKNLLGKGLGDAQRQWQNFGNALGSIGRTMALGGAAALSPLIGAMSTLNDVAKQGSIANALGLTSEQFTGIAGVAKSVGEDTREFIESLVTLGKLGTDAAAGTQQASDAFASMGLNANEFIKLRADEQFFAVFESLNKMQDPLQRTRVLMMAFGEDGGKYLLPLLGKSTDELRNMAAGLAITSDDMKAATSAQQAYTAATSALGKAWQSVSIAAAPIVKILADGIAQAVTPFREFVNANREAVVGLSLAAGGVTAMGIGLMVLGPAISAVGMGLAGIAAIGSTAFAAMGTAVAILTSPLGAVVAATALISSEFVNFGKMGRETIAGVSGSIESTFRPTIDNVVSSWKEVVSAVADGDLESAFEIASASLEIEWVRLTTFMEKAWDDFTGTIVDSFDSAIIYVEEAWNDFANTGFGKVLVGAAEGFWAWCEDIVGAFEWVAETIGEAWDTTIGFIEERWDLFANSKFKKGLDKTLEGLQYWLEDAWDLLTDWEINDPQKFGINQQRAELIPDAGWGGDGGDFEGELARIIMEDPNAKRAREAQERMQAAKDAREGRKNAAWDFGYMDDFGAGFNAPGGIGAKVAELATRSMGGFGGSANVGMFGSGGDVGKQIAANTKATADGVKALVGGIGNMGPLTVEGGV